jgi:hypothetical protein
MGNSRLFVWITLILLITIGTTLPPIDSAWGATVKCHFVPPCGGNPDDDTISGNGQGNQISGGGGDDSISAAGGNDFVCGGDDDDDISGGDGNDKIIGDIFLPLSPSYCGVLPQHPGADSISAGPGDDLIIHGSSLPNKADTASDGHKDYIQCGPGNDVAQINVSVDGDVVASCEVVIAG